MKHPIIIAVICALVLAISFAGAQPYATWNHYREIVVNTTPDNGGAVVSGTETDFPLLVRLSDAGPATGSDVLSGALPNGADIRFATSDGETVLAYEIDDHQNGYYVVTHFSTEADLLPEYERLLKLDDDLLRYLIVVNEGDLSTTPAPIVEARDDEDSDEEE
jgi:ribosomal protein S6